MLCSQVKNEHNGSQCSRFLKIKNQSDLLRKVPKNPPLLAGSENLLEDKERKFLFRARAEGGAFASGTARGRFSG